MSRLFLILIFFCFFLFIESSAQNKLFCTIDSQTGEHIPYVNIIALNSNYRSASDSVGNFAIKELVETDSLLFTCLAYESEKISGKDILALKDGRVYLKYKTYVLGTVNTVADVAKQYVKKAIDSIPKNYDQSLFVISAAYRQYHIENDKAVRLIQSFQDIAFTDVVNKRHIKVKVKNLKRSNNNELNKEKHGDHFFDILLEDPLNNGEGTILNRKALEFYTCQLDTIQTSDTLIKILFKSMNYNQDHIYSGFIELNKKDFAVIKYQCNKKNNPYATTKRQYFSSPYTWQFVKGSKVYNYQKINNQYYLKTIASYYSHKLMNAQNGSVDFKVDEYFELLCDDKLSGVKYDNTFKNYSGLYGLHYKYNKEDWNSSYFENLPGKIMSDLSVDEDLEIQFRKNE